MELLSEDNVRRLWDRNRAAADRDYATRQRAAHIARVKAEIDTLDDTGPKLDASLPKLLDDVNRQPDPAVDPSTVDTRDDRTGEDDQDFQSDFAVQNY